MSSSSSISTLPLPHSPSLILDLNFKNKDLSENVLKSANVELNEQQIRRISEISHSLFISGNDFLNLTREMEPSLSAYKIQIFANKTKKRVRAYINHRQQQTHENKQTLSFINEYVLGILGSQKRFTKTCCLKLKFTPIEVIAKIGPAAHLRINHQSSSPPSKIISNMNKEVNILNMLHKDDNNPIKPHICQIKESATYQGNHKTTVEGNIEKKTTKKIVVYQKLYRTDLFEASKEILLMPPDKQYTIRLQIIKDTAQGLSHIHKRGYIHCDLKPENIFIDENNRAYIGDFGYAGKRSTLEIIGVGTPSIFAPERMKSVLDGLSRANEKSDTWALGCSLLMLLTGHYPYWSDCLETLCVIIKTFNRFDQWSNEYESFPDIEYDQLKKNAPELTKKLLRLISDMDAQIAGLQSVINNKSSNLTDLYSNYTKFNDNIIKIEEIVKAARKFIEKIPTPPPFSESHEIDFRRRHSEAITKTALNEFLGKNNSPERLQILQDLIYKIVTAAWMELKQKTLFSNELDRNLIERMLQINPNDRLNLEEVKDF